MVFVVLLYAARERQHQQAFDAGDDDGDKEYDGDETITSSRDRGRSGGRQSLSQLAGRQIADRTSTARNK